MMDRTKIAAALLACLFLLAPVHAQPAPKLSASWQGVSAVVTWQGAPAGSCLYLGGVFVPVPCGASGSAVLHRGGDAAYAPDTGDVVTLRDERSGTGRVLASVTLPAHVLILPIVDAP